jgi:sec-independent protein translocase protein TatA
MNILFAGMFGGWEIVLILAVVLIPFRCQEASLNWPKALGQGIKEFKKATNDVTSEIHKAMDDNRYSQSTPRSARKRSAQHADTECALRRSPTRPRSPEPFPSPD